MVYLILTLCDFQISSTKNIDTQKGNGYKTVCLKDKLIICNEENQKFLIDVLMILRESNEDFAFKLSECFDLELPKSIQHSSDKASS